MKQSRICSYGLLGVLLALTSCGPDKVEVKPYIPVAQTLAIDSQCKVAPEWLPVHQTDTVTWSGDPAYSVQFPSNNDTPFTSVSATVAIGQSPTVTGGTRCPHPGHMSAPSACYFQYNVLRTGTKCGDPGIHVIP